MHLEIRTFAIREGSADDDEARLAAFMSRVDVERLDTAYADGAWRILVRYRDRRRQEERKQIESAIVQALNQWRADMARNLGVDREAVLGSGLIAEIARYAPTTEVELAVIVDAQGGSSPEQGAAIVQVVRQTMEELTADDD